jgi:hypothetical protein
MQRGRPRAGAQPRTRSDWQSFCAPLPVLRQAGAAAARRRRSPPIRRNRTARGRLLSRRDLRGMPRSQSLFQNESRLSAAPWLMRAVAFDPLNCVIGARIPGGGWTSKPIRKALRQAPNDPNSSDKSLIRLWKSDCGVFWAKSSDNYATSLGKLCPKSSSRRKPIVSKFREAMLARVSGYIPVAEGRRHLQGQSAMIQVKRE